MLHAFSLTSALAALWLLLSGHLTDPLLLGLGAASVLAVVLIVHRMDVLDHEGHPIHLSWQGLLYWPWLLKEIVLSNFDVAKAILRLPAGIEPTVFRVTASQATELGRVIYANSITLTPGTVTIALEDRSLTIHALTAGAASGLQTGEMDRRVRRMAG